jgi:hypothetical protein
MEEPAKTELKRLALLEAREIGENENNVKYNFVIPMLECFGYKGKMEFEHSSQGNRIDIFIKSSKESLLVETKSYGKHLDDSVAQLKKYCDDKRPVIAILCNGEEIRGYSPFWRKSDFSQTVMFAIRRHQLTDETILTKIEQVLGKEYLENGEVKNNVARREHELEQMETRIHAEEKAAQDKINEITNKREMLTKEQEKLDREIVETKSEIIARTEQKERIKNRLREEHLLFSDGVSNSDNPIQQSIEASSEKNGILGRLLLEDRDDARIRLIVRINWKLINKALPSETIDKGRSGNARTLLQVFHRISEVLGIGALDRLARSKVGTGPLISSNPKQDFRKPDGSLYSHLPIPGTPFFLYTNTPTPIKAKDMLRAIKELDLPEDFVTIERTKK